MVRRTVFVVMLGVLLLGSMSPGYGFFNFSPVKLEGMGWFENLRVKRALAILEDDPERPRTRYDTAYFEDAMWVLDGEVKSLGYLHPAFALKVWQGDTLLVDTRWDGMFDPPLPLDLDADRAVITVEPGLMYYFDSIEAEGVEGLGDAPLESFFYPGGFLFVSRADRFYTPGRLNAGMGNILETFRQQGYRDAKVVEYTSEMDDETGAVSVHFTVDKGPLYLVRSLVVTEPTGDTSFTTHLKRETLYQHQPYTNTWLNDSMQEWRTVYYREGYPDVVLASQELNREEKEDQIIVDLRLTITPGPLVRVGDVNIDDEERLSPYIKNQTLRIKTGDKLNRQKVQDGRDRLARLGIFDSVGVDYDIMDPEIWDVTYRTKLKPPYTVGLIFGVGSYDIVRGGFEVEQNNIWGLAHRARLRAIQSLKSTQLDYRYRVPQLFGTDINAYAQVNYLRREEISFVREEVGGSIGLEYYVPSWNTYLSGQYNYQNLQARRDNIPPEFGLTRANVTSIQLNAQRSELDNPIYPSRGYRVQGTVEIAAPELGGDVGYQRAEILGSYHHPVNRSLGLHFGFRHGLINADGPVSQNIPLGKRFFPGGENTVRGYRQGGAGSKDASGTVVGSQTFMLLNVEVEQRLTRLFSVVAFVDTVGIGTTFQDYPFNQVLVSAGGGISIRTLVGPLRFEYGQNLNPRPTDPQGTFQVALGFPF